MKRLKRHLNVKLFTEVVKEMTREKFVKMEMVAFTPRSCVLQDLGQLCRPWGVLFAGAQPARRQEERAHGKLWPLRRAQAAGTEEAACPGAFSCCNAMAVFSGWGITKISSSETVKAWCCHGASIISLNVIHLKPRETLESTLWGEMKAQHSLGKYLEDIFFRAWLKERVSRGASTLLYESRATGDIQVGNKKWQSVTYLHYEVLKTLI